jgi:putative ABC transport system permease protein
VAEIKYRLRRLWRDQAYVAAVVVSLSLGMAVCVSVFSLVNTLVFGEIPGVAQRDRLVRLAWTGSSSRLTASELTALESAAPVGSAGVAAQGERLLPVVLPSGPVTRATAFVSRQFFETLGTRAVHGRLLRAADADSEAPLVVVIGETLWRESFGGRGDVLGQALTVGGRAFTIVGVTPSGFPGLYPLDVGGRDADLPQVWLPLHNAAAYWPRGTWSAAPWLTVALRRPDDMSVAAVQARVAVVRTRLVSPGRPPEARLRALPSGLDWQADPIQSLLVVGLYLFVPFGVLALGCANVINLQLARAVDEAGALSLRLALGATRVRLAQLLTIDVTLLSTMAGVLGWLGARLALAQAQAWLALPFAIDRRVLLFAAVMVVASVGVAGLLPAWMSARDVVAPGLRALEGGPLRHRRLRGVLVVVQVGASLCLLALGGLALRSVATRGPTMPVDPDRILVATINLADVRPDTPRAGAFVASVLERVEQSPAVSTAAFATFFAGAPPVRYGPADETGGERRLGSAGFASPGWFETTGAVWLAGRGFGRGESTAVVINAACAAALGHAGGNAVGMRLALQLQDRAAPVIADVTGVIADTLVTDEGRAAPLLVLPLSDEAAAGAARHLVLAARVTRADEGGRAIRAAINTVDPAVPFVELESFEARAARTFRGFRDMAWVAVGLGGLALLLASVGLYSLLAWSVRQRTREIGVRMALGAQPRDIAWLVSRHAIGLLAIGVVCGLAAAVPLATLLRSVLAGVSPLDPWALGASVAALVVVTAAASALPAWRAARVEPLDTLRAM